MVQTANDLCEPKIRPKNYTYQPFIRLKKFPKSFGFVQLINLYFPLAKSRKIEEEKLLKLLAAAEEEDDLLPAPHEEVTVSSLKKKLLSLNKKSTLNQQLRVKYSDEPTRFMESELELYGEIQQLRIVCELWVGQILSGFTNHQGC